jgi:large subunit ribosomal protein L15
MADPKPTRKKTASKAGAAKKSSAGKTAAAKTAAGKTAEVKAVAVSRGSGLRASTPGTTLATLRENPGARPKRVRIGRGHGSGMVKTGGEGGKGQTVRSGGGKGPAFEGGQTPWARRLPHKRGYSQKGRDTGHFGTTYAVVNLAALAGWDPKLEVSPENLKAKQLVSKPLDGIKILGGTKPGKSLPAGLVFRDVVFSASAREALVAAGAKLDEPEA